MDEARVKEIASSYKEMTENIKEAFILAGVPAEHAPLYVMNFPEMEKLVPEDVIALYEQFKKAVIYFWKDIGLSNREISRRIGGSSTATVFNVLKERESKTA